CARTVAGTIGEVAMRIYREASTGENVTQAVHRVVGSKALIAAINANDPAGARAALRALLVNQIVAVRVTRKGRLFTDVGGTVPAIAPVEGSIPRTDARFALSTQAASSYLAVTRQVTGAHVVVLHEAGSRAAHRGAGVFATTLAGLPSTQLPLHGPFGYRGRNYEVSSLRGSAYPAGALRIALLVPSTSIACPGSVTQATVETLGHVGERIYEEEAHSPYVHATLRHIEADPAFQQAVAARDKHAIRAAIVSFFAAHIHVVRVRAYGVAPSGAQRLLYDLGGPFVLAPVHGVVRSGGRLVGRFSFAIQDDAGYLKLAHRFTGAEVLMRTSSRQVMGTVHPGPATVPDRGLIDYRANHYEVYSFTGTAFPSGTLRISLLLGVLKKREN
ncbi:MAG TPA: hypothetical protein VK774_01095, partial [Solirubrobacteraceae bacterium]|nr:hypothetical protein [Solirubrobacteraceae bacterium]